MKRQHAGGSGSNEFQKVAPPERGGVKAWRSASAARLLTFQLLLCVHKMEAKRLRFIGELWFPGLVCQGFGFFTGSGWARRIVNSMQDIPFNWPAYVCAPGKAKPRYKAFFWP